MSVTLSEIKRFTTILPSEPKNGKLGTILKKHGRKARSADPVKDIRDIRAED
jgi:hypothetical protein